MYTHDVSQIIEEFEARDKVNLERVATLLFPEAAGRALAVYWREMARLAERKSREILGPLPGLDDPAVGLPKSTEDLLKEVEKREDELKRTMRNMGFETKVRSEDEKGAGKGSD